MVIVMKSNATEEEKLEVIAKLKNFHLNPHRSDGELKTVIGGIGSLVGIDLRDIRQMKGVEDVIRIGAPYKLASRDFRSENTVIRFKNGFELGTDRIAIMAGPCSVEGEEQLETTAMIVKSMGAHFLRGGAFKPRTSPYSFQGMGLEGLKLLRKAADANDMLVISEILEKDYLDAFLEYTDIIQVGARNMQNFQLLKELGRVDKPVMIKRGLSSTIEEWLMSAEYVMSEGNHQIILCERGIRTFEPKTRNTLDLSAVPVIKELTHLPIIVDPSHAIGIRNKITPLARAAVAVGADGIMIEVHPNPEKAFSDGAQSLYPNQFEDLMKEVTKIAEVIGRSV